MDKGAAGYLAISAVVCTMICMYGTKAKNDVKVPKQDIYREITEQTTLQSVTDNAGKKQNDKKLSSMPVYAEYAFLDDFNIPHIIVKNNVDQIYGYSLSVKYFDKNNNEIETKNIDIESVIPAGMSESPERYIPPVDGAEFISAAVTKYSTNDGENSIDIVYNEEHKPLSQLKSSTGDAPCALIKTSVPEVIASRGESDLSDIRFEVTNLSERPIKNIEFLAAEYDAGGKPVSAKPNGYIKENIRKLTWNDAGLEKDKPKTAASVMALNKDCAQVYIIVSHIDFEDRGVWSNPNALDWILSQGDTDKEKTDSDMSDSK